MRWRDPMPDTGFANWVLRVIVRLTFALTGIINVFGLLLSEHTFAAMALPDGVRVAVGVLQLMGAVAMFVPGGGLFGGGLLAFLLLVTLLLRVVHGQLPMVFVTAFWLAACIAIAVGAWRQEPWHPDDPIRPII